MDLLDDSGLDATTRERLMTVVRDEIGTMSQRLNSAAEQGLRSIKTCWPLEDMLGTDLLAAAAQRIEAQQSAKVSLVSEGADAALWLKVDSRSRLVEDFTVIAASVHDSQVLGKLIAEGPR